MKTDSIQDYILKNEHNLGIAAAVCEAWPRAREKLVSEFLDRLDRRLKKKLRKWNSERWGVFLLDQWPGYQICKPAWGDDYSIGLQCGDFGRETTFGVFRDANRIKKRPHCEELLSAVQQLHPSAKSMMWWEARVIMRSPAPDWRKPEMLWRMHTDPKFLEEVAEQLLDLARVSERIIDRLARKK
jgi:hypothetical protein